MASFDMNAPVTVTVTVPYGVQSARIAPTSAGIVPTINGNSLSFTLDSPRKLNVEINGEWLKSLHLFADPFETDIPDPNDPNVIYFGPGIHEIEPMTVGSNKTVYIAGGAIVRGVTNGKNFRIGAPGYPGETGHTGVFMLDGDHITLRGRGIIDGGKLSMTERLNLLWERGFDITVKDVTVLDPPQWFMPVWQSRNVRFDNLKLIGFRANSDGIDIYNSEDVTVNNCFIRTLDDLVVIKALINQNTERIIVENCVLFSCLAHSLSLGAELFGDRISDITFRNCDIIHDHGREWTFRIFHSGRSEVSNVVFENIRVEECAPNGRLIRVDTDEHNVYTPEGMEYGSIKNVTFKDISVKSDQPVSVVLNGRDEIHSVSDVSFQNVLINGKPLKRKGVQSNGFVKNIRFK
jgi:hypothetical protein